MKLDPALWRAREGVSALLAALDADDDATRIVGGAVRDTLLALPVADLDLATRLPPETARARIAAAGFKAAPTGIAHGTVTAVLPSGPVEVTTLRRDVATDGRRATVAFTDDWREDAARRDFTINALFARAADGEVIDYFDGETDLAGRHVRFIGDPLRRIAEDHLRILRFFRFHARFGMGDPDPTGLAACISRAETLKALSRERIADELLKLLAVADPAPTVALMIANGILAPVLPEIDSGATGRLRRLIAAERAADIAPDALRRLSAVLPPDLHNIEIIGRRLKLSNAARRRLAQIVDPALADLPPAAVAYHAGRGIAVDRLLLERREGAIRELAEWTKPHFGLTGGHLIALGLTPGPIVAAVLAAIERRWIAEDFPPTPRVRELAAIAVARALRDDQVK